MVKPYPSAKSVFKIALILLITLSIGGCNPFKVTDPADPNFDPDKFSFRDYSVPEKKDVFRKLFPIGTPKTFVDRVLVNAGKATSLQSKDLPQVWNYDVPQRRLLLPAGPTHIFIFNEDNTVENVSVRPGKYLYPERITLEKLRDAQKGNKNGR